MSAPRLTHCHQGHPLTRRNLYRKRRRDLRTKHGRRFWVRECATCVRARQRRRYALLKTGGKFAQLVVRSEAA